MLRAISACPKILVIGSVHLDIVATFDPATINNIDKIGQLHYAVGGSAFNVAANLAYHGHFVSLLSVIKENSLTGNVIADHLKRTRIDCRFLVTTPDIPESAFVAHMCGATLFSAVACIGLEHASLSDVLLKEAIEWADIVAIETNIPTPEIKKIAELSRRYRRSLFVSCVSESKIDRVFRQWSVEQFKAVVMNTREALKVGYDLESLHTDKALQKRFCEDFASEVVIVTRSIDGYDVYFHSGSWQHFGGIAVPERISELGAGDALYAAILAHAPDIDWNQCMETIRNFVLSVLREKAATPGGEISI